MTVALRYEVSSLKVAEVSPDPSVGPSREGRILNPFCNFDLMMVDWTLRRHTLFIATSLTNCHGPSIIPRMFIPGVTDDDNNSGYRTQFPNIPL